MPELPEVETIVQQLRKCGVEGRTIRSIDIRWPRMVEPLSVAAFSRRVSGARIESLDRYGKWMLFGLSSGLTLMVHLRMSGAFSTEPGTHDRAVLKLSGGLKLHFRDTRKFGRWRLTDDPQAALSALGPDALSRRFTLARFREELARRSRQIKPLLLDQSVVAGLGNIYVDEALWEAAVHPERTAASLSDAEVERLYRAVKLVLRIGVRNGGTSLGEGKTNYRDLEGASGGHREKVKAYGRAGQPCGRCGAPLVKIVVAQRGTTLCPMCQCPD